ncbi:hypothetical protein [Leptospira neocaledonica]|uniref:Uncharacterized protein n=1 Tax=Leptospira neocaledonica TaxID=2023192 RepID=A0A2M9ZUJ8_9LEPT|nr:hypothetical protein [Leptospira neocaledonica]PJZ75756.1 hypothetical protein CH365_17265 [Leptospira neocaledonica]
MYNFSDNELIVLAVKAGLETIALFFILWLLFFKFRILEYLHALNKIVIFWFLLFVFLWTTVQVLDRWQYFFPQKVSFYPLARFAMFQLGKKREIRESYIWTIKLENGEEQDFNPVSSFSAIGQPSLSTRLELLREELDSQKDSKKEHGKKEAQLWANSVRNYYQGKYAKKVNSVVFYKTASPDGNSMLRTELYSVVF